MPRDRAAIRKYALPALFVFAILAFGAYSATVSTDFTVYYRAGAQALAGDPHFYPDDADIGAGRVHYFRALPAIAWLFAPFALLPFRIAAFIFFLLKVWGLAGVVTIASRSMHVPLSLRARVAGAAFAAAGGYMVEEMRYGNAHLVVLFALVVALHRAHSGSILLPAALLAISIAVKLTPLLVLLYLALAGRLRVALATVAGVILLFMLPALAYGWETNSALIGSFISSAAGIGDQPRNHSIKGVVARYLTASALDGAGYPRVNVLELSTTQATVVWLLAGAALGAILVRALWRTVESPYTTPLRDSLVVTAMLLLSTHTQRIHFAWLFYPCCVLVCLLLRGPDGRHRAVVRWTLLGSAIAGTVLPVVLPGRRLSLAYEMASPYFFVTLALFLAIAWLIHRVNEDPAPTAATDVSSKVSPSYLVPPVFFSSSGAVRRCRPVMDTSTHRRALFSRPCIPSSS